MQQQRSLCRGSSAAAPQQQQRGGAPFGTVRPARRTACAARPAASAEHAHYVLEVAVVPGKPRVEALVRVRGRWTAVCACRAVRPARRRAPHVERALPPSPPLLLPQVLEAQGQRIVPPSDRGGLHPLLIPLAEQQQQPQSPGGGSSSGALVTCLLRWPEGHRGMELPVVCMPRHGTQVQVRVGVSVRACASAPLGDCTHMHALPLALHAPPSPAPAAAGPQR